MISAGGHGSPADPFAPERIIETLVRHGVEFVLVGGVGAQRHGAQRTTHDIDVVANFDRANLDRLAAAMRELGARIRAEGFDDTQARAVADTMVHPDFFRRQELSTWRTDVGDLDVLHDMPARDGARQTYAELVERSTTAVYGPVTVKVAALADIVASKEWANRPKDVAALPELRSLQERGDDGPGRRLERGVER